MQKASIIYTFVKSLSLIYSFHIAYDNPNIPASEACNRSQELMQGNKGNYFLLTLSFAILFIIAYVIFIAVARKMLYSFNISGLKAWSIFAYLVFGILYLWQIPYMNISTVCLYDTLIHKDDNEVIENEI